MKLMTEQQIEQLAREHTTHMVSAQGVSQTYLQAVVFATQAALGRGRRPLAADVQLAALERVEAPYYAAVLRGVITDDVADNLSLPKDERRKRMLTRNSRSGFARSAKATIVAFIRGGGDIRTVDAATISKDSLRRAIAPPEPSDRLERRIERASKGLQRALERQARGSPDAARETAERLMEELQTFIDGLEAPPAVASDRGARRTRVGAPMLHAPS